MSDAIACALCLRAEDPRPNRVGGVDLCRRCHDGGAVAAARARGFQIGVQCGSVGHGEKRFYMANGSAALSKPLFDASFRRKGFAQIALFGQRKHDPFDQTAIEREVAVLLVHLDRYSE